MKTIATIALLIVSAATTVAQAPAVPAAVTKAFQQAYPGATISKTAAEREKNRTLFRVDGVHNGRRRVVLYDANGAAIEIGEQVDEKDLPPPVRAAIKSHRRAIYVSGLEVTRGGNIEYRLTVKGSRRTAMIAKPDGTVISFE